MAEAPTIHLVGESGTKYKYWIDEIGTGFQPSPANYAFVREASEGTFRPISIGQTGDISGRFDNHHKMPCIERNGATHICTHNGNKNEEERRNEVADLIAHYKPICNG